MIHFRLGFTPLITKRFWNFCHIFGPFHLLGNWLLHKEEHWYLSAYLPGHIISQGSAIDGCPILATRSCLTESENAQITLYILFPPIFVGSYVWLGSRDAHCLHGSHNMWQDRRGKENTYNNKKRGVSETFKCVYKWQRKGLNNFISFSQARRPWMAVTQPFSWCGTFG